MFKIYCQFHESPKDLTQLNNPISQSVKAWQIRFLGHCLQRLQEDLISAYALYHLTNGKPRPGGRKILSHEYTAKLINPENPPPTPPRLPHEIGSAWRLTVGTTGNPMRASAELNIANKKLSGVLYPSTKKWKLDGICHDQKTKQVCRVALRFLLLSVLVE